MLAQGRLYEKAADEMPNSNDIQVARGCVIGCVRSCVYVCMCVCVCVRVCWHVVAAQVGQALEDAETFGRLHRDMATEAQYVRKQLAPGARNYASYNLESLGAAASNSGAASCAGCNHDFDAACPQVAHLCVLFVDRRNAIGIFCWRPGVVAQRGRRGVPRPWRVASAMLRLHEDIHVGVAVCTQRPYASCV